MRAGQVFDWEDYKYQMKRNIFKLPKNFFYDIKCCWQRIHKGYCDKDLWSIYDWFLDIMPQMLSEFKEIREGSPCNPESEAHAFMIDLEDEGEKTKGKKGKNKIEEQEVKQVNETKDNLKENQQETGVEEDCHAKWDEILNQMIFLFNEANRWTCQKKNPYEEEYWKMYDEFKQKYGSGGEKLQSEEEKKGPFRTMHFPSEIPEYKQIDNAFYDEEKNIDKYREDCKNQAFELFSKWFTNLWT